MLPVKVGHLQSASDVTKMLFQFDPKNKCEINKSTGYVLGEWSSMRYTPKGLPYSKCKGKYKLLTSFCSYARPAQPGPDRTRLCGPCIAAIAGD